MWASSGGTALERSKTLGYSYAEGICSDYKYSIAEEIGGFAYISVSFINIYK